MAAIFGRDSGSEAGVENGTTTELPPKNGVLPPATIHEDAVRRTILEFSRVTEQTAILASFLRGYMLHKGSATEKARGVPGGYEKTARQKLTKQFIEALHASLDVSGVHGSLEVIDLRWRGYEDRKGQIPAIELMVPGLDELWKEPRAHLRCGGAPPGQVGAMPALELAALPVDGLRALLDGGAGGSVVAIAATSGRFEIERWHAEPAAYSRHLVIVLRPGTVIDCAEHHDAARVLKHWSGAGIPWYENECVKKLFEQFWTKIRRSDNLPPRIETIDIRNPAFGCKRVLSKRCQIHDSPGSSVAAALSIGVSEHGPDAFVGILRGASVPMVAAAALATGSQFIAIELVWGNTGPVADASVDMEDKPDEVPAGKKAAGSGERWNMVVPCGAKLLHATDFIPSDHFALIVTSITNHRGLRGIHQVGSNFETETLIYNAHYSSLRVLRHRRDIGRDMFYGENGSRIPALEAIRGFLQ